MDIESKLMSHNPSILYMPGHGSLGNLAHELIYVHFRKAINSSYGNEQTAYLSCTNISQAHSIMTQKEKFTLNRAHTFYEN